MGIYYRNEGTGEHDFIELAAEQNGEMFEDTEDHFLIDNLGQNKGIKSISYRFSCYYPMNF